MNNTPATGNTLQKDKSKGITLSTQLRTIFQFLQQYVASASMVSDATGIPQKNICQYKRDLEKAERLWKLCKRTFKVTGFKASYITTDTNKALNCPTQRNLF